MIPILKTSDIDLPPRTKNYSELLPKHGGNVYNNQNRPDDVTRNMTQDNRHNKSQGIWNIFVIDKNSINQKQQFKFAQQFW